jgi:hypothetical protein
MPPDQNLRPRRAKAASSDEAEFRWRAGMAFQISSLSSVLGVSGLLARSPTGTRHGRLHFATNLLVQLAESGFSSLPR